MSCELAIKSISPSGMGTSRVESDSGHFVEIQKRASREQLKRSNFLGLSSANASSELGQVFQTCRKAGWDGYDALPVSVGSYAIANTLLDSLPLGTPTPSFGAEPDGCLTMEWHASASRTLSVSISPDEKLHYAAIIGASDVYGTEPCFGEMPRRILDLIPQVYVNVPY